MAAPGRFNRLGPDDLKAAFDKASEQGMAFLVLGTYLAEGEPLRLPLAPAVLDTIDIHEVAYALGDSASSQKESLTSIYHKHAGFRISAVYDLKKPFDQPAGDAGLLQPGCIAAAEKSVAEARYQKLPWFSKLFARAPG